MIPILDLRKQIAPIRSEIDAVVKRIIDNVNFVFGGEIDEFEKEAAAYCKIRYAIGVSNGTDAIRLSLLALGIKPGDTVICPAFTYYASAGAIASVGAIPVFADINPATYLLSADSVEKVIQKDKKRIKAIVPVHLYGQCADMDSILAIARKYKLGIVEDVAQAFGAAYKGRKAGTIGDCGAVSFFPGKNLGAFGDAGAVLTQNRAIAERLRILRNQGNKEKYHHLIIGYNNRLDVIQAAVLRVKLKYLDSWNKKRAENASYYNKQLRDLPLQTPFVPEYATHIYHQYVLRLNGSSKKMVDYLRSEGIDARVYYPTALHFQKCFKYLNYKKGDFPESEKASRQTFAIPVHPDLNRGEMDFIIATIRKWF